MAPNLSRLSQTVQIRGHYTCFCADLTRLTSSAYSHLELCNVFSNVLFLFMSAFKLASRCLSDNLC